MMQTKWMALFGILMLALAACRTSPMPEVAKAGSAQKAALNGMRVAQLAAPTRFIPSPQPLPSATPMLTDTPKPTATMTHTPTTSPSPAPSHTPSSTPFMARSEASILADLEFAQMQALLFETPPLYIPDEGHLRRIYAQGAGRALRSNFMLNVGDCNTESRYFMQPLVSEISSDGVADLYLARSDVQELIAYYQPTFDHKGQAANSGFNALSVMDPLWTRSASCQPGESPLACDIRLTQPFAMTVMFGANDVLVLTTDDYEAALRDIIEYSLSQGVIPILSTFTFRPQNNDNYSKGIRMNAILRLLADEYQIPLINFWQAARDLPGHGILPDNAHLQIEGFEIRNQLSIEMLRYLRSNVIEAHTHNEGSST